MRNLIRRGVGFMVLVMLLLSAWLPPAQADTTFRLTATPTETGLGAGLGGFSLQYVGVNVDSLFHVSELVPFSFSGVWKTDFVEGSNQPVSTFYATLTGAAGTQGDSPFTDESLVYRSWTFAATSGGGMSAAGFAWTYQREIVPLPTSALLLGTGLIPLAWARRQKRLGK